jgi:hypothetical protein
METSGCNAPTGIPSLLSGRRTFEVSAPLVCRTTSARGRVGRNLNKAASSPAIVPITSSGLAMRINELCSRSSRCFGGRRRNCFAERGRPRPPESCDALLALAVCFATIRSIECPDLLRAIARAVPSRPAPIIDTESLWPRRRAAGFGFGFPSGCRFDVNGRPCSRRIPGVWSADSSTR